MSEIYVVRSRAIAARAVGGEMMIMSAADSTFFTLNEVATLIWQSADGQTPLSRIVTDNICPQFEIDAETATRDARSFVDALSQHGILIASDHPIMASGESREETL